MKLLTVWIITLLLLAAGAGAAFAQPASWLDSPLKGWNTAGMANPPPAPAMQNSDPRCRQRERAAGTPQERLLTGTGWKLEAYWPVMHSADLTLITALADYDGMCRPLAFNVFVFSRAAYAGTLSPVAMNSRSDGVLATPGGKVGLSIVPNGLIEAVFTRYASSDPLCCPSRGMTCVTYDIKTVNGGSLVVPVQTAAVVQPAASPAATAAPAPRRLPRTGGGGAAPQPWKLPAILAATLLAAGLLARSTPQPGWLRPRRTAPAVPWRQPPDAGEPAAPRKRSA